MSDTFYLIRRTSDRWTYADSACGFSSAFGTRIPSLSTAVRIAEALIARDSCEVEIECYRTRTERVAVFPAPPAAVSARPSSPSEQGGRRA